MELSLYESLKKFLDGKAKAGSQIDPNELLAVIKQMEYRDPGLREYRLMKFESRNSRYVRKLEDRKASFEAVIATAVMALKSAILINGAACVAMMGLIAGVMKENSQSVYAFDLNYALSLFGFGVFTGAIATAATYFAQYYYNDYAVSKNQAMKQKSESKGNLFRLTAITLCIISYASFLYGLIEAYKGMP